MPNLLIWYHCVIPPSKSGGRETSGNPSQPPPGSPAPCPTTSSESAKSSWLGYSALARATRVRVPVAEFGPVKSKPKPTSTCVEFVHVPSSWTLVPDSAALHTLSKYSIASARQRVRMVKEMDSKSIGLCPQGFESPHCRSPRFQCCFHLAWRFAFRKLCFGPCRQEERIGRITLRSMVMAILTEI
jgi:hypothetical protein